MPFDIPEENQDETAVPGGLQKPNYPFAGTGVQLLPYLRLSLNGIPPTDKAMGPNQVANTVTQQPVTTPKLSFAQRIAALGQNPFSGSFSNQNQNAERAMKMGIGHRIMAGIGQQPGASAGTRLTLLPKAMWKMSGSRPQSLPDLNSSQPIRLEPLNTKSSAAGFNNGQRYGEFFSEFVPPGADVNGRHSESHVHVGGFSRPSNQTNGRGDALRVPTAWWAPDLSGHSRQTSLTPGFGDGQNVQARTKSRSLMPSNQELLSGRAPQLLSPIGKGQPNKPGDLLLFQKTYNKLIDARAMLTDNADFPLPKKIPESGRLDQFTAKAISDLERRHFYGISSPAGIITPKGTLFKSMVKALAEPGAAHRRLAPEMYDIAKTMVPRGGAPTSGANRPAKKKVNPKGTSSGRSGANLSQPPDNVNKYLPSILMALDDQHLNDPDMVLMALATIRAETAHFAPVDEGLSHFNTTPGGHPFDKYDKKNGNLGPGEGERFKGRGFVQLSGRDNYRNIGNLIGHPELVTHPEKANDPAIAAEILAQFLKSHEQEIRKAIKAGNLVKARKLVNGGGHGLHEFIAAFHAGRRYINQYVKSK